VTSYPETGQILSKTQSPHSSKFYIMHIIEWQIVRLFCCKYCKFKNNDG